METAETVTNSSNLPQGRETTKLMQSEHIDNAVVSNNNNEIHACDDNGNQNTMEGTEHVLIEAVRNASSPSYEATKSMHCEHIDPTDVTELTNTNNNNNDIDLSHDNGNLNEEEDLNLGDTSNYTPDERNTLFQRGLEYDKNFRTSAALQCYVGCIQGLKNGNMFAHLPQCLRKIAAIHNRRENLDRAAQLAQSERLVYGTAPFEAEDLQQKIDEIAGDSGPAARDLNELNIDAMRAEEYEHMAKLCWLKKQNQLALEYAGRCAKLEQQIYGNNHEKTKSSLSFFATVYAELRRQQYSQYSGQLDKDSELTESTATILEVMSSPESSKPVSILRQRSDDGSKETEREKKQVRFHESVDEDLRQREKEAFSSISLTLIRLAVCVVILASIFTWLYCSRDKSQTCKSLLSPFQGWMKRMQYYYRTLFSRR